MLSVFLLALTFAVKTSAQEAQLLHKFGGIPCGYFMAIMDATHFAWKASPGSNIYVVYYGARYRREALDFDHKTKKFKRIKVQYAHKDDGLSWAKSVPLFLTTFDGYSIEDREILKDKIILISGGYREDIAVELYLAPNQGALPPPTPTIAEQDIIFGAHRPRGTRDFTYCYAGL